MIKVFCDGCRKKFGTGEAYITVSTNYPYSIDIKDGFHFHPECAYRVEAVMDRIFAKERAEAREE